MGLVVIKLVLEPRASKTSKKKIWTNVLLQQLETSPTLDL
jgi:hypothetical protein